LQELEGRAETSFNTDAKLQGRSPSNFSKLALLKKQVLIKIQPIKITAEQKITYTTNIADLFCNQFQFV